jgi:hypothetical protein
MLFYKLKEPATVCKVSMPRQGGAKIFYRLFYPLKCNQLYEKLWLLESDPDPSRSIPCSWPPSGKGVFQGVSMDSLKYCLSPPYPTILRPAGSHSYDLFKAGHFATFSQDQSDTEHPIAYHSRRAFHPQPVSSHSMPFPSGSDEKVGRGGP